jgi:aspartate/methionine/tyrosine aminotransferase
MQIEDFALERYFARHEFNARFLLSPSDCESLSVQELIALADDETRGLWQDLRLGYTESPGHPRLRAEISHMYSRVDAANVLEAAPEEAIFLAMHALLRPGDRVVVLWPAYQSLYAVARSIGCEVVPWPVELRQGKWSIDLDRLEGMLPGSRLLVVNFPHNPTGFLPTRAEFERIVEMAEQNGVTLFSDEMYRLLERDPADRLPAACDLSPQAISLTGLSKAFGLPGLRIGWLATRNIDWLARCQVLKDYTTICGSAPAEILAIMALRAQTAIVARCAGIVARNQGLMEEFCARRSHLIEWIAPTAGSTAFPRWVGTGSVEELCAAALAKRGLMIVPGSMFDAPGSHFRVGLGRENFPLVLQELQNFLDRGLDGI